MTLQKNFEMWDSNPDKKEFIVPEIYFFIQREDCAQKRRETAKATINIKINTYIFKSFREDTSQDI